jgi:hypothetical protein
MTLIFDSELLNAWRCVQYYFYILSRIKLPILNLEVIFNKGIAIFFILRILLSAVHSQLQVKFVLLCDT